MHIYRRGLNVSITHQYSRGNLIAIVVVLKAGAFGKGFMLPKWICVTEKRFECTPLPLLQEDTTTRHRSRIAGPWRHTEPAGASRSVVYHISVVYKLPRLTKLYIHVHMDM